MRKLAVVLALALGLGTATFFTGCNRDGLPPEAEGKTVVKIAFYAAGFGTEWMDDLKARYEAEHPDVYLKLESDPYIEDTVKQRLDTNRADLADDLCVLGGSQYRYMVRNDLLMDLTSFYDEIVEGEDTVDSLVNQQLKEYYTVNGKTYGIPWQNNAMSFVYNASMFEKYGWDTSPDTMQDFFELCEQIRDDTNNTVNPLVYCGKANQGYFPGIMENWLCQYEGVDSMMTFLECESADVYKDQIEGRTKVYETVAKLIHGTDSKGRPYIDKQSRGYDHLAAQSKILEGSAAMVISGPWMQIEMSEYLVDYPNLELGIMPTPHINDDMKDKNGNDSQYARTSTSGVMVVPKLAKNADIALDFMKFMLTQSSLERFVETTDGLTRPFTLKNPENCDLEGNNFAQTVMDLLTTNPERMVYTISSSDIWLAGEASMWMANEGAPMTAIANCSNLTQALAEAKELANEDYERIRDKWDKWQVA